MRVALLSCGESLRCFPGVSGAYDLTIGVNDAATFSPCDYLSIGDHQTYQRIGDAVLGMPTIWTHEEAARRIGTVPMAVKTYVRVERQRWTIFSVTAGLWLAGLLGARSVECFGLYSPDEPCLFGANPLTRRTADRWATECEIWDATVAELSRQGVEVIRHGSN